MRGMCSSVSALCVDLLTKQVPSFIPATMAKQHHSFYTNLDQHTYAPQTPIRRVALCRLAGTRIPRPHSSMCAG